MTVAVGLLTYALLTAVLTPVALGRAPWLVQAPRLGLLAWQAALAAVLAAMVLMLLGVALPTRGLSLDLPHLLHACWAQLSSWTRAEAAVLTTAAAAGGLTAGALAWALVAQLASVRRERSEQRDLLALAGHPQPDGALLVPAAVAAAYCVPGGRGHIVLTTAAHDALDDRERAAVIAHERAHLRGRHDLLLLSVNVAARAFGWLPFFRQAQRRVAEYVEMLADDAAVRTAGAAPVATALLGLAGGPPPGSLGAGGSSTVERVTRLIGQETAGPPRAQRWLFASGVCLVALGPWVLAVAPVTAAYTGYCPPV